MRSTLYLILSCLFFFVLFSSELHARSLKEIQKSKELRICLVTIHPSLATATPKACKGNCQFEGPNYDLSLEFAKSLGKDIQAKFIHVNWQEQFFNSKGKVLYDKSYTPELMKSGQCDLYPNSMTRTDWRTKKLDFVILFPNRMMAIVPKNKKRRFASLSDLAGKTTVTVKDSSFHTWLLQQNKTGFAANPIQIKLKSFSEGLKAVDSGQIDFMLSDANLAIWSIQHELKNSTVAFTVGEKDEIGWAFRKSDQALQKKVQQFFQKQLQPASVFNQIWKKYYDLTLTQFISTIRATR